MTLPDWLQPTLALLPAMLIFFGAGTPLALALLPRRDWRNVPLVLGAGLALGAVGVTTALFVIGTLGRFSAAAAWIAAAAVWAVGLVAVFAFRRADFVLRETGTEGMRATLTGLETLLIGLIAVTVALRFWNTAYWPFTTYDALWVYGYNAKLFILESVIPARMGYYPQLIPLSYTYGQLIWGGINDHAARVVIPFYALIGIMAAYLLGRAVNGRRTGLIAAAVWALYPHHAVWSQFGDLEVTVTAFFTLTAAFFVMGWRERTPRYYALSGLFLAGALWTKPTAGALIQSLALIGAGVLIGGLRDRRVWGRLRGVIVALAVGFPIGGMWYVRNVLYGHPPLVLPPGYWQSEAQRSGAELGWVLLIAVLLTAALIAYRVGRPRLALIGVGLLLAGALPSAFGYRLPTFDELSLLTVGQIAPSIRPTALNVLEYAVIGAGAVVLLYAAFPAWRSLSATWRGTLLIMLAFIAPYFVTWFWSYSYHFRLSFPIIPLLIAPLAALIDALIRRGGAWLAAKPDRFRRVVAAGSLIAVCAAALPGGWGVLSAIRPALYAELPDDTAKVRQGNAALMGLVDFLAERRAALGRPLKIIAPGELRLNFFFPQDDIQGDIYPLWLDDIAGVDYFVDSSVGQRLYTIRGERFNQILSSLTRDPVMWRAFTVDDRNFRFSAYEVNNVNRFKTPEPNGKLRATLGDFAFLHGHDLNTLSQVRGQPFHLTLWWEALKPSSIDYSVFIHLWDPVSQRLGAAWGGQPVEGAWGVWYGVPGEQFDVPYPTRLWQTGEVIKDEWREPIPLDVPPGQYELRIGLYDPISGERLPIMQDGKLIGDTILLNVVEVRAE